MKERLYQYPELLSVTQDLIRQIQDDTGRPVAIRAEPRVRGRGRAIYVVSDPDPTRHLVLYDPSEARHLDHLVAHECGHIRRFAAARSDERSVPVVPAGARAAAARQLAPDLSRLLESGVPEGALAEMLPTWTGGIVGQVASTPSDVWIERAIWREYPALRAKQKASLLHQLRESSLVMRSVVAAFTPDAVWYASNAMNYVLATASARLLKMPELTGPYRLPKVRALGQNLFDILDARPDSGLAGDRAISELWADRLGIRDWFEWRTVTDVPVGARRSWEVGE